MMSTVYLFLLAAIAAVALVSAQVESNVPQCRGVFDFYFVLDSSGSVGAANFRTEVVPFVRNVSVNFVNPDFRLSFVTFASSGVIHLNLTSNREKIAKGIENLQSHGVGGSTNLATGLQKVNEQIDMLGGDTASVILILTDGVITDQANAMNQAMEARRKGASIFAIGVANVNRIQLSQLVTNEREVFIGSDFEFLTEIINQVVNDTCIEILSAAPVRVCTNQDELTTTLTGQGFTNTINSNTTACRFLFNETDFAITKPVGEISYDRIVCSVPNFKEPQDIVLLQVTLNGISYISSNVTMTISECKPVDAGLAVGLTFGLLALIVIIVLLAIWFFLPLLTGKIFFQKSTDPEQQPQDTEQPKKWATVDASYYGGRGAGGITPVKVQWGDKGATAEGNKLTAAKDANILQMGEDALPSSAANSKGPVPSCIRTTWNTLKRWLFSLYRTVSSFRPVRSPQGGILWCPYCQRQNVGGSRYRQSSSTMATAAAPGTAVRTNSSIDQTSAATRTGSVSSSGLTSAPARPTPPKRSHTLPAGVLPPSRPPVPARPPQRVSTLNRDGK